MGDTHPEPEDSQGVVRLMHAIAKALARRDAQALEAPEGEGPQGVARDSSAEVDEVGAGPRVPPPEAPPDTTRSRGVT